jgi:hypothetical protein
MNIFLQCGHDEVNIYVSPFSTFREARYSLAPWLSIVSKICVISLNAERL